MPYISTFDRNHLMLCSLDTFVESHSIAILIDAFVNSLNLKNMKEKKWQKRKQEKCKWTDHLHRIVKKQILCKERSIPQSVK